jgi:hypothetical protein
MWDFRTYYFTAKAFAAGLNPYNPSDVQRIAGEKVLEFYYFPLSLHFFKLFTYLPYKEAARLFIFIKFALGRYGDDVIFNGHLIGFDNLHSILKVYGKLYFSVPIGPQRIEFNGHRVFSVRYLLELIGNTRVRQQRASHCN